MRCSKYTVSCAWYKWRRVYWSTYCVSAFVVGSILSCCRISFGRTAKQFLIILAVTEFHAYEIIYHACPFDIVLVVVRVLTQYVSLLSISRTIS
ncbi:hypothetical protein EDD21DRAFT_195345 [Dissophora ornata]|nr:hypothetical protein EDD21DRAFT_195345 [Dissophora ornata]